MYIHIFEQIDIYDHFRAMVMCSFVPKDVPSQHIPGALGSPETVRKPRGCSQVIGRNSQVSAISVTPIVGFGYNQY